VEKTLRGLTAAVQTQNCNALIDSLSAESLKLMGLERGALVSNCQANFQELQQFGGMSITNFKVVSQTGARAVVSTSGTAGGEPFTGEDHFIRENGNWKIDLPSYG
jgi:hypothetical protein